jgi:fatty-acyl-CoA synthase
LPFKFGLVIGMVSGISHGHKVVFPSFFPDTLATIKAIHNEKCTALKGAPVIFIDLLNHPELSNHDLSSLEAILLGASTVPKDLLIKIKEKLNLKHVIVG